MASNAPAPQMFTMEQLLAIISALGLGSGAGLAGLANPIKPAPVVVQPKPVSTYVTPPGVISASGLTWTAYYAIVNRTLPPRSSQNPDDVDARTAGEAAAEDEYRNNPASGHNVVGLGA